MLNFNQRLKEARINHNMTQKDLADVLHITPRAVQNYEAGNREPNIATLNFLANYFGMPLDYLLGRKTRFFVEPDGEMKYSNILDCDGNSLSGKVSYSFGAFTFNQLLFQFFYVHDLEGNFIERIKKSQGSFEFLAFITLLNNNLNLSYDLHKQNNGWHRISLIVKAADDLPFSLRYKAMYLDLQNGKVVIEAIPWGGYENFISDYLNWPAEKKIEFLANHA